MAKNKLYDNVEEAYKDQFSILKNLASRHLYRPDISVDVVHTVFSKVLDYLERNKDKEPKPKISSYLLYRQVLICCKKENKYSKELPSGLLNQDFKTDLYDDFSS